MNINETLESLRVGHLSKKLDISDCHQNPELQFNQWLEEAIESKCDEPNAFVLSTVRENQPRARVVLLKGIRQGQFVFYTNYQSAKGEEISSNDKICMTFLWLPLHRQIRIEGTVSKVEDAVSDQYFQKRPRGSQLGAIASPQSKKVPSREELEKLFLDADKKFSNAKILPRPIHWGGFQVAPHYFEFWQGRDNRMHDRIAYEKSSSGWKLSRLAP